MGGIDASYPIPKKGILSTATHRGAHSVKHKMLTKEELLPVDNFVEKRKTPNCTVESSCHRAPLFLHQ